MIISKLNKSVLVLDIPYRHGNKMATIHRDADLRNKQSRLIIFFYGAVCEKE